MRLTPLESSTLHALRHTQAVFIDGRWRLKGAPAPRVNMFALAALFEAGLVRLRTPQLAALTAAGERRADALTEARMRAPCSSPLGAIRHSPEGVGG